MSCYTLHLNRSKILCDEAAQNHVQVDAALIQTRTLYKKLQVLNEPVFIEHVVIATCNIDVIVDPYLTYSWHT